MKKRISLIIISVVVLVSCIISGQYLFKRCIFWYCPPARGFTLNELELPNSIFPDYIKLGKIGGSAENEGAIDSVSQNGVWDDGKSRIVYNVWQFGTAHQAYSFVENITNRDERENTNLCKLIDNYEVLSKASVLHADHSSITCRYGISGNDFEVFYQANYNEYAISFMATLDSGFTIDDYYVIINYIDSQMVKLLSLH